jgi:hypothetical protein
MVDAAGPVGSPTQGSAIDVIFNLGRGCCQTHRQRPQGPRHRCLLQPQWWTLSDPLVAPRRGPTSTSTSTAIDMLQQVVGVASVYCQCIPGGHWLTISTGHATSKAFHMDFFSDTCNAKDSKKTTVKKISSNITKIGFIYKTKVLAPQIEAGSPMRLQDSTRTTQLQASSFPRRRPMQPPELSQWVLAPPALGKPEGLVCGSTTTRAP